MTDLSIIKENLKKSKMEWEIVEKANCGAIAVMGTKIFTLHPNLIKDPDFDIDNLMISFLKKETN